MENIILAIQELKKFSDEKTHKELIWEGKSSRIMLICLKPGQEIKPHVHDGDHIWAVMEGSGEFLSSEDDARVIGTDNIVIAPEGQAHGIRNNTNENLVFASITV